MSNVLVVVYSYTGTSRRLAQLLAAQQQWTLGEVRDAQPRAGNWRCVLDSLLRRRPEIVYEGPDPGDFAAVVLVAPVWVLRLAGPMRTFVATRCAELHDVAMISVMGGKGAPNAVAEVTRLLGRAPLLDATFTAREIEDGSAAGRLQAIGDAIQQAENRAADVVRPAVWSAQAG
jgi:hypothetical protein